MRKFRLALAVSALTISASVAWSAQAAPLTLLPSQNRSAVQQVGCTFAGRCPLGRSWVCRERGCWCAPCGGYYRGRYQSGDYRGGRYYWGAPWRYPLSPWRWHY
jgi:hypothetical protein